MRKAPLLLMAGAVLAISCMTDRGSPGLDRIDAPVLNDACSGLFAVTVGSATPNSDTTLAVTLRGPSHVYECDGAAAWEATVTGANYVPTYYWYAAQCTGTENFCADSTNYFLLAYGTGHNVWNYEVPSNVRAMHVYVVVCEVDAPNCRDGVSRMRYTKGPAWDSEPVGGSAGTCFGQGFPLQRDVNSTVGNPPDQIILRRWYTRDYCTGQKKFQPGEDTLGLGTPP